MRNVIIAVSSTAMLVLLFVGYYKLTYVPPPEPPAPAVGAAELPPAQQDRRDVFRVGGEALVAEVAPGHKMAITLYDERTGEATDRLVFDDWRRVPGSEDEILVENPELTLLLPDGATATIAARRAQITVSGLRGEHIRPRHGWFDGEVRLTLTPRGGEAVTLRLPRMDFDLDLGQMRSDGEVRVDGPGVRMVATGLDFVWNQAENRVERLRLRRGAWLELDLAGSLLGPGGRVDPSAVPSGPREQRRTGYRCVLSGDVRVEQHRGALVEASLRGQWLELLFDVGGARPLARSGPPASSAPASRAAASGSAASQPATRLVVRWNGPLSLEPAPSRGGPARRIVRARGQPLVLESADGRIRCGMLEYAAHSQRLWLRPLAGELVRLTRPDGSHIAADAVYVDRGRQKIVLVGDVQMDAAPGDERLWVSCTHYAELDLMAAAQGNMPRPVAGPLPAARIERAVFVGDVRAAVRDQRVACSRLAVDFAPGGAASGSAPQIRRLEARGSVLFRQRRRGGWPVWLERVRDDLERLAVALTTGHLPIERSHESTLRCDWLRVELVADDRGQPVPRRVDAAGGVRLRDPEQGIDARAAELWAAFDGGQVARAELAGRRRAPARLRAEPYRIAGPRIALAREQQKLVVPRDASLRFPARRDLRGERSDRVRWVRVRCAGPLRIVGDANDRHDAVVELTDGVVARVGNQRLHASRLTLWIETLEAAAAPAERPTTVGLLRKLWASGRGAVAEPGLVPWRAGGSRLRREPSLLVARDAVLVSEQYAPGREVPVVQQSIVAPELRADLRARRFRTRGVTQLFMIDRRLGAARPGRRREGPLAVAPSALVARGPSQTAMQCDGSLLYVLGEPGPDRRDLAFLDGGVIFRRVSGREMVGWEKMLPAALGGDAAKRTHLAGLASRNTWLECDRLEAAFGYPGGSGPELVWLNARQRVYLRDQTETTIRSIYAEQIQFDRLAGIIRVVGDPQKGVDARIYDEDTATGRFAMPAAGPVLIVDLRNNTIRTGPIRGKARGG